LRSGFVVALGGVPVFGLAVWLSSEITYKELSWLAFGLFFGILFGLADFCKHITLRTFLWRQGDAPLRFDKFLYHAKDRRLMRQVGSGFVFIHRYFLDYFADYYERNYLNNASK